MGAHPICGVKYLMSGVSTIFGWKDQPLQNRPNLVSAMYCDNAKMIVGKSTGDLLVWDLRRHDKVCMRAFIMFNSKTLNVEPLILDQFSNIFCDVVYNFLEKIPTTQDSIN